MSQLTDPIRRVPAPLRIALVALVALAVAIPALAAIGASPAPGTGPAAATAAPNATGTPDAKNRHDGGRLHGARGFRGGPGGHNTITAIDGANISLATDDGWTRTITLGPAVAVTRGDAKIAAADLKIGDQVRIRETRNADGSFTVVELRVVLPHLGGTVTAVGDASLTLKLRDGTSRVVTLTAATTYRVGPKDGTKADVTVGVAVDVVGTAGAGDAFTAVAVHVRLAGVHGTVTAVSGSTITITTRGKVGPVSATIHVGADTIYAMRGYKGLAPLTIQAVTVGMRISAAGTLRADGSLDATIVAVREPKSGPGASPAP
jgi:hypothetical protein